MEKDPKQQKSEPGQQDPTPTSQAAATEELSDEQLDQVAGGSQHTGGVNFTGGVYVG